MGVQKTNFYYIPWQYTEEWLRCVDKPIKATKNHRYQARKKITPPIPHKKEPVK